MSTLEANGYARTARQFLAKAQEAFQAGDLAQASEKGWGAAAQILKAMAQRRGRPHRAHIHLSRAAGRLVEETADRRIQELFAAASGLHQNFYESWWTQDTVRVALDEVRELVDRVDAQLAAGG